MHIPERQPSLEEPWLSSGPTLILCRRGSQGYSGEMMEQQGSQQGIWRAMSPGLPPRALSLLAQCCHSGIQAPSISGLCHSWGLLNPAFYHLCPASRQMKRGKGMEALVGKYEDPGVCLRPLYLVSNSISQDSVTCPHPPQKSGAAKCHPPVCHRRRGHRTCDQLAYHGCSILIYNTRGQTTPLLGHSRDYKEMKGMRASDK